MRAHWSQRLILGLLFSLVLGIGSVCATTTSRVYVRVVPPAPVVEVRSVALVRVSCGLAVTTVGMAGDTCGSRVDGRRRHAPVLCGYRGVGCTRAVAGTSGTGTGTEIDQALMA